MPTNQTNKPPIPPDVLEAIEHPKNPLPSPTDAEWGFWMKCKARQEINEGIYKSVSDIDARTRLYANWFNSMTEYLSPETIRQWMKIELMYAASAIKYLRELKEAENCNK